MEHRKSCSEAQDWSQNKNSHLIPQRKLGNIDGTSWRNFANTFLPL